MSNPDPVKLVDVNRSINVKISDLNLLKHKLRYLQLFHNLIVKFDWPLKDIRRLAKEGYRAEAYEFKTFCLICYPDCDRRDFN